jgi:ATP:ADP antiporter, AAA family
MIKHLINKFYDVREGEWLITTAMFFINFLLMVILYLLKPARDSLFLVELGPEALPFVFILVAVFSIPVTQLVSKLVQKYNNYKVFVWTNIFVILNLLAIRGLFLIDQGWVYTLFYIWVSVYSILIISQFWVFANELYNTSQSKRLFSLLNLGAILGAIAGSQFSSIAVSFFDIQTENLLFLSAAIIFAIMAIVYLLKGKSKFESEDQQEITLSGLFKNKEVVKSITGSKYQLVIAGIIGVAMLVSTLVDYQLKAIAADVYPETAALTSFMGTFYAGLSIASLLIQILFSGKILRRMGVGGAVLTRPAGMFIGSVLMMFEPVLAVVVFLGGFDGATQYSIDKTSREILFLPLSQKMKERVKFFLDVFIDRFFRGIAGFILLILVFWFDTTVQQLAWLVTASIGVWLYLSWLAKKLYVEQFRETLNKRYFEIDSVGVDMNESSTVDMVCNILSEQDSRKIHYMLKLLEGHDPTPYQNELRVLLSHPSSEIRLQAIRLLKSVSSQDYIEDVEKLLNETDTELRLESIHYICQHADENPEIILMRYLQSDNRKKKAATVGCISKYGTEMQKQMISSEVIESIINHKDKDMNLTRAQVAQVLRYHPGEKANRYLPVLINDPSPAVRREAVKSMAELKDQSFIPLLIHRLEDAEISYAARKALSGYDEELIDLFNTYYNSGDFSEEVYRKIPLVMADMNHQSSVEYLLSMLEQEPNEKKRRYIIKGLNKLRSSSANFTFNSGKIDSELKRELKNYYRLSLTLQLVKDQENMDLLARAIKEKQDRLLENIFRLLGLIHHHKDIYGVFLGLQSTEEENRSKALELLDNVLNIDQHKYIISILDPSSEQQTAEKAKELFNIHLENPDQAIMNIMNGSDSWLKACALYGVTVDSSDKLKEKVKESTTNSEPIVAETANLILNRIN